MVSLVIALVYALLPTIISLFNAASTRVMMLMMNEKLYSFSPNGNVLEVIQETFPFYASVDVSMIIYSIAIGIAVLIMLFEALDSYVSTLQGEEAERPLNIIARFIMTLFILLLVYGIPVGSKITLKGFPVIFTYKGILYYLGNLMANWLSPFSTDLSAFNASFSSINFTMSLSPAEQIVIVVLSFALFKGTIEAGITFVERWLSFAVSIIFGPIAISLNASRKTAQSYKTWAIGLFAQAFTIFVSMVVLVLYIGTLQNLVGISIGKLGINVLFNYAVAIALLSLFKNSEKIANSFGIRTILNGQAAREYAKGAMAVRRLVDPVSRMMTMRAAGAIGHAAYSYNRNKYGANAWQTKAVKPFDLTQQPTYSKNTAKNMPELNKVTKDVPTYDPKTGAMKLDENGKPVQERKTFSQFSAPEGGFKNNPIDPVVVGNYKNKQAMAQSMNNVNQALEKGIGAKVAMSDVTRVLGLEERDDFKMSNQGVIGNINGNESIIFKGIETSANGKESASQWYAISLGENANPSAGDPVTVPNGDMVSVGNFTVASGYTMQMGENSAKMVTLSHADYRTPDVDYNNSAKERYNQFDSTFNDSGYIKMSEIDTRNEDIQREMQQLSSEYANPQQLNTPVDWNEYHNKPNLPNMENVYNEMQNRSENTNLDSTNQERVVFKEEDFETQSNYSIQDTNDYFYDDLENNEDE